MQANQTYHLLISCGAQSQLETCVTLFRDAGLTLRAHRVSSLRDLGDMLRDPQWDLLIADDNHPELSPADALRLLAERGLELPCIVRAADPNAPEALACLPLGAREVIGITDGARLLAATRRDVAALREHRELVELRGQYAEIAHRVELLLAASQDAIAYVADGMHIHANELYARLFGYDSVDDLAAAPLVDLIAPAHQQEFKGALRRYRDNPDQQTSIEFTGLRADGGEFTGSLVLSTASFEGEPCMQVLVRAAPAAAAAGPTGAAGTGTSAPSGIGALGSALAQSGGGHLLLIGVGGFAQHCRNLGVVAATRLVDALGEFLAGVSGWPHPALRVGDSTLAVIVADDDTDAVAATARQVVEQVSTRILGLGAQSATCSVGIAVCPVSGIDASVDLLIDHAFATLAGVLERAEKLRGADPARVEIMRAAEAAPEAVAASEELDQAIAGGAFRVLFQPIVSLRGDASEYYEVQVIHGETRQPARAWLASTLGNDSAVELDHWAITEACRKLAAHRGGHPATRLILGIGGASIADPDFVTWLSATLRGAELPPESIVVQMSHRDVSTRLREATLHVERLRGMGCQISMSDVHSANNPIADIAHIRPQFARIDDALSEALKDVDSTNTLLKPLIESLHQEQIASVMPNVAGAGVLAVLWQLGVHFIQGDYLQAPAPEMHYEFTDLA